MGSTLNVKVVSEPSPLKLSTVLSPVPKNFAKAVTCKTSLAADPSVSTIEVPLVAV